MTLSLLASALLAQSVSMSQNQMVDSLVRVALTPVLDGKIEKEEWDNLAESHGGMTYFQWEPEIIYWAAHAKTDQDIVLSLDYNADGWLVGDDNLELRIKFEAGEPRVRVRFLDATDPTGPMWRDGGVPPEAVKVAAAATEGGWILEGSYVPPYRQGPEAGKRLGVRVDAVPANIDLGEAYLPRGLAFVNLQLDSSRGLLPGMSWRPVVANRSVAREDRLKLKFEVQRDDETVQLNRFEYRGEGLAKDMVASGMQPFPPFNRNKSALDFDSIIARDAVPGWRVIRAEILGAGEQPILLRTSVRIADVVDFEVAIKENLQGSTDMQIIRTNVILRSQFTGRIEGTFFTEVPQDWSVSKGKEQKFAIYHSRGTARIPVEIIVPRNTVGVFPLTFKAKVGDDEMFKTIYLPIE